MMILVMILHSGLHSACPVERVLSQTPSTLPYRDGKHDDDWHSEDSAVDDDHNHNHNDPIHPSTADEGDNDDAEQCCHYRFKNPNHHHEFNNSTASLHLLNFSPLCVFKSSS